LGRGLEFVLLSKPHEYWRWFDHTATYTDFKKEMWVKYDDEDFIVAGQERSGLKFSSESVAFCEVNEDLAGLDTVPLDEILGVSFLTVVLRNKISFKRLT
jgi:hypothetical protein